MCEKYINGKYSNQIHFSVRKPSQTIFEEQVRLGRPTVPTRTISDLVYYPLLEITPEYFHEF